MRNAIQVTRFMGAPWVLWRMGYAARKRSGALRRRFPATPLSATSLRDFLRPGVPVESEAYRRFRDESVASFFFPRGELPSAELFARIVGESGRARTISVADDACRGRFVYYSRDSYDLGDPVDWLLNPLTDGRHHVQTHWCDYATFSADAGDIKDVWEPSRFSFAFWLVRAYALTGDDAYPRAFWRHFESWCDQNPPQRGPNWMCGQETALRVMAWCFALYAFWRSPETSDERVSKMAVLLGIHADRIEGNIGYAVSQKNNHGLSEAVGLLTVGLLFPEFKRAAGWVERGSRIFTQEVRRQVYADGSYVQQSMNYHRVMLHDCLWAIRLAKLNDAAFDADVVDRISAAGEFLFQMLDEQSGGVPNYGPSDGALIFPLSGEDYQDYRPTVQATFCVTSGERPLGAGPWDETVAWLCGEAAIERSASSKRPASRRFDAGGYYTLRTEGSWCMVRCHTYRDRPTHVDPLHVDLWWNGQNVLADGGTFKYFDPASPARERFFKDIRAHNTVVVDREGPLRLASRFLWVPWPSADCTAFEPRRFVGESHAYRTKSGLIVHRRSIAVDAHNEWTITDEVEGAGTHDVEVLWRVGAGRVTLCPERFEVSSELAGGRMVLYVDCAAAASIRVVEGLEQDGEMGGWASSYYGERHPAPTVIVAVRAALPVRIESRARFETAVARPDP